MGSIRETRQRSRKSWCQGILEVMEEINLQDGLRSARGEWTFVIERRQTS
jgi:hypothetical protein